VGQDLKNIRAYEDIRRFAFEEHQNQYYRKRSNIHGQESKNVRTGVTIGHQTFVLRIQNYKINMISPFSSSICFC